MHRISGAVRPTVTRLTLLSCILTAASATASSRQPSLSHAARNAAAIVHGTVAEVSSCTARDQTSAWTFVDLNVHETFAGRRSPAPNQPPSRHTVRFRLGRYANGTAGGFAGTPRLTPGEEVVLLLRASGNSGQPAVVPINLAGDGLYRFFDLGNGQTAVVDGAGLLVLTTAAGQPVLGPAIKAGRANFPPANPIDPANAVAEIKERMVDSVKFDETPLIGSWRLATRFSIQDPVEVEDASGRSVPKIAAKCTAHLFGAYDGQVLQASGTCLSPYVGNVKVDLTGRVLQGQWWGEITLASEHPKAQEVVLNWRSALRTSEDADALTGAATKIASATPEIPSNVTLIQAVEDEVGIMGAWVGGVRPAMSKASFLSWLRTTAVQSGDVPEAPVYSTPMNAKRCNERLVARPVLAGGPQ